MLERHWYHYHELFEKGLVGLYFLLGFRALGLSMIGIFIPLFLFVELQFSLSQVIVFYLLWSIAFAIISLCSLPLISRYGTKMVMVASVPLLIIGTLVLWTLASVPVLYLPAAVLQGLSMGLFWMGFHVTAIRLAKRRVVGKEMGLFTLASVLGAIAGPVIGGVILMYSTFPILFLVTSIVLFCSMLPLLFSKEIHPRTRVSLAHFFHKKHRRYFFAYVVQGMQFVAAGVFWPLFIFTILGSYQTLGSYASVTMFAIGMFSLGIGAMADVWNKRWLIRIFAPIEAILWVVRPFVSSIGQVFTIGFLSGLSSSGIDVPLLAKTYAHAKKDHAVGFILFREISLRIGEILLLLLVLLTGSIVTAFYASGIGALAYLFF